MNAPIVKWILPFALGILLENLFPIGGGTVSLVLSVVVVATMVVCTIVASKARVLRNAFVVCFMFSALLLGYNLAWLHNPLRLPTHYYHSMGEATMFEVTIIDKPTPTDRNIKVLSRVNHIRTLQGWRETEGKAIIYFAKDSIAETLNYGDKVLISAKLQHIEPPFNPKEFDYKTYMERRDVFARAYVKHGQYTVTEHNVERGIMFVAYSLRHKLIDIIQQGGLSEQEKAIALAMLLGWDENVDAETLQKFSVAGVSHILCVSGLHLGIVSAMVGACLFFLGNSRRSRILKGCIKILALWLFAMMTGLAPSAMRAATMFSLMTVGNTFFTRSNTYNNIATSALILLVLDPDMLFDVGFQLSYSAVIGIVALHPWLTGLIKLPQHVDVGAVYKLRHGEPSSTMLYFLNVCNAIVSVLLRMADKLWSYACVSIAAQLFVMPFILYYFHNFPVYFILANVVIVPFVGVLLVTLVLMLICSPIQVNVFEIFFSWQIKATYGVLDFTSLLPFSLASNIYFDTVMLAMSLLLVVSFALGIRRRWKYYFWFTVVAMLCIMVHSTVVTAKAAGQREWVVYSTNSGWAMEIFDGNTSYLVADSLLLGNDKMVNYMAVNCRIYNCIKQTHSFAITDSVKVDGLLYKNGPFMAFGNKRVAVLSGDNNIEPMAEKLHLTHLILNGKPRVSVAELQQCLDFDTIVIAARNSSFLVNKWIQECELLGVPYYNIEEQGAYEGKY